MPPKTAREAEGERRLDALARAYHHANGLARVLDGGGLDPELAVAIRGKVGAVNGVLWRAVLAALDEEGGLIRTPSFTVKPGFEAEGQVEMWAAREGRRKGRPGDGATR